MTIDNFRPPYSFNPIKKKGRVSWDPQASKSDEDVGDLYEEEDQLDNDENQLQLATRGTLRQKMQCTSR